MNVTLTNYTDKPQMSIANIGGISHGNEVDTVGDAKELIKKFINWGHMSPIEFADATFLVEGMSRSCLSQITRHRLANYMVKSQRYCSHDNFDMVIPESIEEHDELTNMIKQYLNDAQKLYNTLVRKDVPKEDARFFLPIGTETDMYIKSNFRELRHIISIRGLNEGSQWEIRNLGQEMLRLVYPIAPSVFEDQYKTLQKME